MRKGSGGRKVVARNKGAGKPSPVPSRHQDGGPLETWRKEMIASVFISGDDVYVAGNEVRDNTIVLWKNGDVMQRIPEKTSWDYVVR